MFVDPVGVVLRPFVGYILRQLVLIVDLRLKAFMKEILQFNRTIMDGSISFQIDVPEDV